MVNSRATSACNSHHLISNPLLHLADLQLKPVEHRSQLGLHPLDTFVNGRLDCTTKGEGGSDEGSFQHVATVGEASTTTPLAEVTAPTRGKKKLKLRSRLHKRLIETHAARQICNAKIIHYGGVRTEPDNAANMLPVIQTVANKYIQSQRASTSPVFASSTSAAPSDSGVATTARHAVESVEQRTAATSDPLQKRIYIVQAAGSYLGVSQVHNLYLQTSIYSITLDVT